MESLPIVSGVVSGRTSALLKRIDFFHGFGTTDENEPGKLSSVMMCVSGFIHGAIGGRCPPLNQL
jgi:hypothetical protein